MLELVVAFAATVLVLAGIAVALGPALPRRIRALRLLLRRAAAAPPPAPADRRPLVLPGLHPTTQRAVQAASRMAALLSAHGYEGYAVDLRAAVREVGVHETEGLRALRHADLDLQRLRIEDEGAYLRFRQLQKELRQHVGDRAEQLELLLS
jgi:hypothetical protein